MWYQRISRLADYFRLSSILPNIDSPGQAGVSLSPQTINQLNRLKLNASRYIRGRGTGTRPSIRRHPAYDFREHRKYAPGDDIRFVDWRASARNEHIFIKQGEYPKDATVHLLLDCSASMNWGEPPKLQSALSIAASVAFLALSNGDRFYFQTSGGRSPQSLGPITGKGQIPTLFNFFQMITFEGRSDLVESIRGLIRKSQSGLIFIISDLLDVHEFRHVLELLPAPKWDVVVIHLLHPLELKPQIRGDFQMVDAETGRVANYDIDATAIQDYQENLSIWRDGLETVCIENNAFYVLIPTDWSLEQEVIPFLRSINLMISK